MAVIHSDAPPVHRPWWRNLGFGLGSLLLLAFTVWMFYFDYHRDWKVFQRQFQDLEVARTEAKLAEVDTRLSTDQRLASLQDALDAARAELETGAESLKTAQAASDEAGRKYYVAEQTWKVEKSYYDAQKYIFEEKRRHIEESGGDESALASAETEFQKYEDQYHQAVLGLEVAKQERDAAVAGVKALTRSADDATKKISQITDESAALQRKIDANSSTITTRIRNAPVLDMASPVLKVEQVILPNLLTDINFIKIPKVDRCITCHRGIMDPGYQEDEQPFKTHPKLDLYLTDNSPHSYTRFGCTVCHQGLDRATSFISAMHTPRDEEQEHEWVRRYDWVEDHYWDAPQLPVQHAEAACRTCHVKNVRLKGADRYNRGLDIIEKAGCVGCHKINGYEDQRKAGPDLRRIASKVSTDWAYRWIEDPRAYRPTTWMPKFFNQTNTSSPEAQERSKIEIAALVSYLFKKSESYTPGADKVPAGDAAHGKVLVSQTGCLACHRVGEQATVRGTFGRDFGPALDRVGDKVTREWLYDWVRDPQRYFPETNMPDLRLTDQEAADVVAYLMTLKGGSPEPAPAVNTALLDQVTEEYLRVKLTHQQAKQKAAAMSGDEKQFFLGEKLVARYGCFGCHSIAGFEQSLPIGVELSNEGTKMITRFDFGFVKIPHSRTAWFLQKMKDPRIFDTGKVKAPQEKLKMPNFGFTDEEAETMVTLILSMQKDVQPMESHQLLDERHAAVEKGRRIVQDRNCRGCHVVEGEGGAIQETIADQAYFPPNLIGEGQKVQSDWLFNFVKGPVPIRPWLNARMPTFGFDNDHLTAVVRYFAALDDAPYPFHTAGEGAVPAELLRDGKKVFEDFKCMSCHTVGTPPPGVAAADLAPNLLISSERLRHDWILKWLKDPQKLLPGTRMPGFFYSDDQPLYPDADRKMQAVKEYLLTLSSGSRSAVVPSTAFTRGGSGK